MLQSPTMIANPKSLSLHKIKLTLLWYQSLLDPAAFALPETVDIDLYQGILGSARSRQTGPLTVPWPPHGKQLYWERYLGQWRTLREVKARQARRAFVPLRAAPVLGLRPGDTDTEIGNEGFL